MAAILRMPQVVEMTGVSRAHIYALIARGEFPRPVRIGKRAVGWMVNDVEAWISARPSAGSWNKTTNLSRDRREKRIPKCGDSDQRLCSESLDGGQP